jgi:hypothetical protein
MTTDDELLATLRARAGDPDRRLECRTSAFFDQVSAMDVGQLLGALGEVQADLGRHVAGPLATPPDVAARVEQLAESMRQPADRPLPAPASLADVEAAEAALGCRLPTLLRRVLAEVADGGFGPGYGLLGVGPGGWTDDRGQQLVAAARGFGAGVVPIAYLGDVVYACVDTTQPSAPVLEFDPSQLDWEDEDPDDDAEAFTEVSPSLAAWLEAWAASPGHAEQRAALEAQAGDAQRDFFRRAWSGLTAEERAEYGITDEMLATGELPPDW